MNSSNGLSLLYLEKDSYICFIKKSKMPVLEIVFVSVIGLIMVLSIVNAIIDIHSK